MSAPASRADWTARGGTLALGGAASFDGGERRKRAFATAQRHSRLVRRLRLAIPLGLALIAAALTVVALFDPFRAKVVDLLIGDFAVDGSKITMDRPKLTGFRRDGRAYVVNAAKAIQDVRKPTLVELRDIDGELEMGEDGSLRVTADVGFFDSAHEQLELTQNVRLRSPTYVVTLKNAKIDFKTGLYDTKDPVTVKTSNGATIAADSATARNGGQELTFSGHVRSEFPPEADSPPGAAAKESTP
jgi:lipopolysaccharide export system protein LptC